MSLTTPYRYKYTAAAATAPQVRSGEVKVSACLSAHRAYLYRSLHSRAPPPPLVCFVFCGTGGPTSTQGDATQRSSATTELVVQQPSTVRKEGSRFRSWYFTEYRYLKDCYSLELGNPFNRTSPNPGEKVLTDNVFIFRSTVVTIEILNIQIMSVVSVVTTVLL